MASSHNSTCNDHPDENLSHYCVQCLYPICTECLTEKHNGHRVTKLLVLVSQKKVNLTNQIKHEDQNALASITKDIPYLHDEEARYMHGVADIRKEINSEFENVKAELDKVKADVGKIRAEMKQTLSQSEQDLKNINDMRTKFEKLKREYKKEMKKFKGFLFILITLLGVLLFLGTQTELSYERPAWIEQLFEGFSPLTYKLTRDMSEILKTFKCYFYPTSLVVSTPEILASFRAEIQGAPSICTTHDGRAWIGGSESRELILVDTNGKIYNRRKVRHRTRHLAMMASSDIIIKSHKLIRLQSEGTEREISGISAYYGDTGVSVTSDERILMCTTDDHLIAYRSDGTNVQKIYENAGILIHAIELPDKTICISDLSNNRLVVIDKNGQQITTITQPLGRTNYMPWGLACDRMGNILSVDRANDCVYIIDQIKEVKELVGPSHGIKDPRWMDIDKDDNLWIAQEDGTITVVKYLA